MKRCTLRPRVGLEDRFTRGELKVRLRHLPPEDGLSIQAQGLAETVAIGGVAPSVAVMTSLRRPTSLWSEPASHHQGERPCETR